MASYSQGSQALLANGSANGSAFDWPGGRGVFNVRSATFAAGTVKLQWSTDLGVTWADVDASGDTFVTKTAVGAGLFELPPCKIRAAIVGSPTAIYADAMTVNP